MAHRIAQALDLPSATAAVDGASARPRPRILVLGFEELMYAPLRLGTALERIADADVRYSTTTRSPVLAVDDPGYAIRTRLVFPAHDDPADGPGERYAYNVAGGGFDAVVAVVDSVADTPRLHAPDGLLAQLAAHTPHVVLAVVPSYIPNTPHTPGRASMLPEPLRGPAFSSYAADEVGWLLQDLSDAELEAPTEEREEAIQSGARTTPSRCRWSTSRAPSTSSSSRPRWTPPLPASPAPSAPSPKPSSPRSRCAVAGAGRTPTRGRSWSRWPAPAPPSGC